MDYNINIKPTKFFENNGGIPVFLWSGQSNTQNALISELIVLEPSLTGFTNPNIRVYNPVSNLVEQMVVGVNNNYEYQPNTFTFGQNTLLFGGQITFGLEMIKKYGKVVFINFRGSGTFLKSLAGVNKDWNAGTTGSNSLVGYLETYITSTLSLLRANGENPVIKGMIWNQGENDAGTSETEANYLANEIALFARIRNFVGNPRLPIINVRIPNRAVGTTTQIQTAKFKHCQRNQYNRLVNTSTSDFVLYDGVHLDSASQLALGNNIASTFNNMNF
jgi:hypothetical protein